MAFQIQDDILDVTSSTEVLGKPVHSDEKNEKTTWVTLYGLEKAREDVVNYSEEAMSILTHMQGITNAEETFLYTFVAWLIQRKK
jgi:geranylgeranyl diphosphate synthase type II